MEFNNPEYIKKYLSSHTIYYLKQIRKAKI